MPFGKIYVPVGATRGELARRKCEETLAKQHGGFTTYRAQGGWYNSARESVVHEEVFVIECVSEDTVESTFKVLTRFVKELTDEPMVLAVVNGEPLISE